MFDKFNSIHIKCLRFSIFHVSCKVSSKKEREKWDEEGRTTINFIQAGLELQFKT